MAIRSKKNTGAYPDINNFLEFVEECVEEASDPVFGVKQRENPRREPAQNELRRSKHTVLQTSVNKSNDNDQPRRKQPPCAQCEGGHPLFLCYKFKALKPPDRLTLVKEKEHCLNCLKQGHKSEECWNPRVCKTCECNQKHSYLLHDALHPQTETKNDASQAKSTTMNCNSEKQAKISLPCVEIEVRNGAHRIITKALLDSGSDRSYCKPALLDQLQLKGGSRQVEMQTLHGVESIEVTPVSFDATNIQDGKVLKLNHVYSTEKFPSLQSSVATKRDTKKWPHLCDLPLSNLQDVSIIIGQDHPEAFKIQELRFGRENQPYAVQYPLGWAVSGPIGQTTLTTLTSNFASNDLDTQVSKF